MLTNALHKLLTPAEQVVNYTWRQIQESERFVSSSLDLMRFAVRAKAELVIERQIPRFIIPSLQFSRAHILQSQFGAEKYMQRANVEATIKPLKLKTDDNYELDGVSLVRTGQAARDQKAFVYFLANNELWQQALPKLHELFKRTGYNVYCYNYRGTGQAQACLPSEKQLVSDAEAQVRALLTQAIAPAHIFLFGSHTLGGPIAILTAAAFADEGTAVNIVVDRAPRSIKAWVLHSTFYFKKSLADLFEHFSWKLDVSQSLSRLRGRVTVIKSKESHALPYDVSIQSALDQIIPRPQQVREVELTPTAGDDHLRPLSDAEWVKLIEPRP